MQKTGTLTKARIIQAVIETNGYTSKKAYEKEGARIFPSLVPIEPNDPASPANRKAWEMLSRFDKPFLTAFSDGDPISIGGERIFQKRVAGAKGQLHKTIEAFLILVPILIISQLVVGVG